MSAPLLALDLSTRTGWACGAPGGRVSHGTLLLPQGGGRGELGAVAAALADGLRDLLEMHQPSQLIMEAPLPPQAQTHAHTARVQLYLAAVVELMGYRWNLRVTEAPSQSVRSKILGTSRFSKAQGGPKPAVIQWCRAAGYQPGDDNAADALMLLHYGWQTLLGHTYPGARAA